MNIGDRIKRIRNLLSREDFGKRIGVSKTTIQNYETKDMVPKGKVIQKIVEEFGVSVEWLLTGAGEPWPSAGGDGLYVAGKREEKVIDGARFRIQHVTPESVIETADQRRGEVRDSGVSSFGKASDSLREIYDKADPVIRIALEANLEAFKLASKMISDYRMMEERVSNLEDKVAELQRLIEEIRRIIIKHGPPPEIAERREDWALLKSLLNLNDGANPSPERSQP